jgi:aminopeptidase N
MQAVTQFRKRDLNRDYLLFPDEWSSYTTAGKLNSKQNAFVQLFFDHRYKCMGGNGLLRMQLRTPLTYNYAFLQGEVVQNNTWRKLDFKTRVFARYGIGNDLPQESVLFMQGANPEEMMESKWVRSQGIAPRDLSGMSKTDFSNIHMGGGLNLRGYTGYYAIDEDEDGNDIIVIRYCRGDKKSLRKLTEKGRILMYDKYGYDFSDDKQDTLSTMRGYFGDK